MASRQRASTLRQIRVLFAAGAAGGLTDAELLERFAAREGEAAELAFAVLVERHGPMVLRICRQVLRDGHAAEDAFQAAFLVLAQRARSLRVRGSLAPWLQAVAWRTSSRLRRTTARRRLHERKAARAAAQAEALVDPLWDDLGEALHAEIGRLPARYRIPLVLCYLEGLTSEEAARQLGWPAGTVRSRLTRGREQLRKRLILRGITPSAVTLAAALVPGSAWAAVPAGLADTTARMAVLVVAGHMAAGTVPAAILTLTEGVLHAMAMTKWKMAAFALLASGLLAGGALVSAQQSTELAPTRAEPDRLRVVEEKLDRLLKKFDDAGVRIAPAPDSMTASVAGAGATTDRDVKASAPAALNRQGRATTAPVPNPMAAEPARHRLGYAYGAAGDTGLEQRVARLEDRLARVEHMLADLLEANRARATTPETRGRPRDDPRSDALPK
jgi:RNA polymerase sigma factor (sigma-70 family)